MGVSARFATIDIPQLWALNSAVECHLHTVEVTGSNPVAPTIIIYLPHSHLRAAVVFCRQNSSPTSTRWRSLSGLRRRLGCQQLLHVLPLCIQRLGKISWGVDGAHLGLAVTEQGLGDRDVLGDFVRPRAQAVAETVPAKTLTLGHQPQSHDSRLNEVGVHGLTPQRLLSLQRPTVSGVTGTIDFFQPDYRFLSVTQNSLSRQPSRRRGLLP